MVLQITLDSDLEQFVRQLIASGRYANESELFVAALQNLADADDNPGGFKAFERLRADVIQGIQSIERGEGTAWNADEIKTAGRELLQTKSPG